MNLEKVSGIYAIVAPSGSRYIGSAVRIAHRWRIHKSDLRLGKHANPGLTRAFRKYGLDALRFEVVEFCTPSELLNREQFHIDTTPKRKRFNCLLIAGSNLGAKRTPEQRERMRQAQLGKKRPPEVRAKISAYQQNKPAITETTRFRMRQAQLKRAPRPTGVFRHTDEAKQRMAVARSASTSTSGFHGVGLHKCGRWRARVGDKHIGVFDSLEEAVAAREAYLSTIV